MGFEGFSVEGLGFLEALPTRDPDWFKANKKPYQALVADPAKAFVTDLGERLHASISPAIEAQPKTNGSIAPINNDLRFAPDKPPYKDHLMFRFWEGSAKKTAPTLMVHMSPQCTGFATSVIPASNDLWRTTIADDASGAHLATEITKLAGATDADVVGSELKKVPKPYDPDHPRGDLLRHKALQVRWIVQNPPEISSAGYIDWCHDELVKAAPLHALLVRYFA